MLSRIINFIRGPRWIVWGIDPSRSPHESIMLRVRDRRFKTPEAVMSQVQLCDQFIPTRVEAE